MYHPRQLLPLFCYRMWQWQFGLYCSHMAIGIFAIAGVIPVGLSIAKDAESKIALIVTVALFAIYMIHNYFVRTLRTYPMNPQEPYSPPTGRENHYRESRMYKSARAIVAMGFFISAALLCYFVSRAVWDDPTHNPLDVMATLCSYLFAGSTLLHVMSTLIGILASNENIAIRTYNDGDHVNHVVDLRFLAERRTRLEQTSVYHSDVSQFQQSTTPGVSVHAPSATVSPKSPRKHLNATTDASRGFEQHHRLPLFVRCACCVDTNDMIPLLPAIHSSFLERVAGRRTRHETKVAAWARQREQTLRVRTETLRKGPDTPEQDVSRGHHELCQTCIYFAYNLHRISPPNMIWKFEKFYNFRRFFAWSPRDFTILEHAACPEDLARSSKACHFCSIIWDALSPEQQAELLDHDAHIVAQSRSTHNFRGESPFSAHEVVLHRARCIRIAVRWNFHIEMAHSMIVHYGSLRRPRRWFRIPRGHGAAISADFLNIKSGLEEAPPLNLFRPPRTGYETAHPSTVSVHTLRLVQRWLQELAIGRTPGSWMPSRVLDVSGQDNTIVRVVHREEICETDDKRYVALSHCWGEEGFLTYNDGTANEFSRGIPVSRLARTFQEAIDFTRRLQIPYLWIDSLCILQKNAADWEREAPTMCNVYMSAFLTVASVASWSATEGLYRD